MKKYLIALTAMVCLSAAASAQTTAPKKTAPVKKEASSNTPPSAESTTKKNKVSAMAAPDKSGEAIKRKHHQAKAKKAVKTTGQ